MLGGNVRRPLREEVKRIRGLKTGWLIEGNPSGPILFCIHGYPDSPQIWDYQAQYFSKQFLVVRPYIRGVSPSDPSAQKSRYGLHSICMDHLEILQEIDPQSEKPVILLGHDLGAAHAWKLAPFLQSQLRALIVINGPSFSQFLSRWRNPRQWFKSWYMLPLQVPLLPEWVLGKAPRLFTSMAYASGGLKSSLRPLNLPGMNACRDPLNQYRAFLKERSEALMEKRQRITQPVLYLAGNRDRFLEPVKAKEVDREAEKVTIRILEGNHWLHRECQTQVNTCIEEFLKKTHV